MNKFCIVTNSNKDQNKDISNKISKYIVEQGGSCHVIDNVNQQTGEYKVLDVNEVPTGTQCIISIGGDGTLIHAAKDLIDLDVVFVGVNKGNLGFLAEISPDFIKESIDKLLNDNFNVESRMMLKGKVMRNNQEVFSSVVLNDIVIHRGGDLAITDYQVFVNDEFLGNYQADGILIATPTGSTAYNLSAGGPVARPDSKMIILTPICPHTLANRTLLLSKSDVIDVKIGKSRTPNEESRKVAFDGDGIFNIIAGDVVSIRKAKKVTKIAKLDESSFLQAIKDKIK